MQEPLFFIFIMNYPQDMMKAQKAPSLPALRSQSFSTMRFIITFSLVLLYSTAFSQPKPGTTMPEGKQGIAFNMVNAMGKRDGLWVQQWKETGNLLYRGNYKNGVPIGDWERYFPDGSLMAIMKYAQDSTIVDATFFFENSQSIMTQGRFIRKRKEGNWKLWNEAGVLLSDENYQDSLLHGTCKYFYPSGKILKTENYKGGLKNGPFTEYYDNGRKHSEGAYLMDEKDGAYKIWFESGKLDCEGKYLKGLQDGMWYYNHKDGRPKISLLYSKGKEQKRKFENGTFNENYDTGIPKSEYNYENGKKDGSFIEWYDKGQYVQVEGSIEDQKTGIVYREKLEGTQIKVKGDYVNDHLEGEVVYYRENGSIEKVEEWSDGKLIRTRQAAK